MAWDEGKHPRGPGGEWEDLSAITDLAGLGQHIFKLKNRVADSGPPASPHGARNYAWQGEASKELGKASWALHEGKTQGVRPALVGAHAWLAKYQASGHGDHPRKPEVLAALKKFDELHKAGTAARMSDTWARRDSDLNHGPGSKLWDYWTRGAGLAKWSGATHKWTALRDLLLAAGVPAGSADGLTTNIIQAVMPGYMKQAHAGEHKAGRADMAPLEYFRTYELEDIHVVRAAHGDSTGRLVEAYAAVFNVPAEIHDHEGHYVEEIDPAAFNKAVADASRSRAGFGKVKVMYNHGMTIHGTPSERGSMPIGTPVEIRPEARGLLTLTRYSETPFADEVLENIRNGSITAQSFTGRIVRSDPSLRRGDRHRPDSAGNLRTVRRTELGLREYGPTPFEAYTGAEILGVRMSTPGGLDADPEPDEHDDEALPPDGEAAAGEPLTRTDGDVDEHSARYHQHALYRMTSQEARERVGLVW